jgi:1-acyl-sn-glycerol-3-phosphate acyltransferase
MMNTSGSSNHSNVQALTLARRAASQREALRVIIQFLVHTLVDVEYVGLENVPPEGQAVILATNHMSRADIPILFVIPHRHDVTALVTNKYKKYPIFYWILRAAQIIWIDRDIADFAAMRAALEALRTKGVALGIAPEGTRSSVGRLLEGKPGVVFLAERARVPIVPVAIAGSEKVFRMLGRLRRPHVTVRFGRPFSLPPLDRANRDEWQKSCIDEIMCRIAAMLPEEYRGFYAHHPRVQELLAEM